MQTASIFSRDPLIFARIEPIIQLTMNVASAQASPVTLGNIKPTENTRANLQIALLRKAMELQQETAERMTNLAEGKGQNIDIRV
jgi:hypothetical protein